MIVLDSFDYDKRRPTPRVESSVVDLSGVITGRDGTHRIAQTCSTAPSLQKGPRTLEFVVPVL
jgi:hypothetical protein